MLPPVFSTDRQACSGAQLRVGMAPSAQQASAGISYLVPSQVAACDSATSMSHAPLPQRATDAVKETD